MSGEVEDGDIQASKAPMLDHEDEDISEVRQGLNMLGFCGEVVNWLLGNNMDILKEVNNIRRAVRIYGKGQRVVQAHVSEACRPSELPVW